MLQSSNQLKKRDFKDSTPASLRIRNSLREGSHTLTVFQNPVRLNSGFLKKSFEGDDDE